MRLPSFSVELVGEFHRTMVLADFETQSVEVRKGDVVVLELPQRMNGGGCMPWTQLEALSKKIRREGARLHMDGARLWEVQPFYDRSLGEICALFDTVYVSFYKGLGGMSGAMLCGGSSLVAHAKGWRERLAGNVFTLSPQWIDAQAQLRAHKDGFGARLAKLRGVVWELSEDLDVRKILRFEPCVPESCMVHVYIMGGSSPAALEAAHERVISATGIRLWNNLRGVGYAIDSTTTKNEQYFEWNMGPANSAFPNQVFLDGWRAFAKELGL
jgi:hypothetical protein